MSTCDLADEYFNRSLATVRGTERQHRQVRYAVFSRTPGLLTGVADVAGLLRRRCAGPVTLRSQPEGRAFAAGEVVMTIEGPFGQLVCLETEILGLLALSGAAGMMAEIVAAAGVPVIDMAARHYPPELIPRLAVAAAVGGAAGTSTRAGHAEVHARFGVGGDRIRIADGPARPFQLYGSIPHALNAVFEGSSIESAAAYHERCPKVPLTVLIDYEGRERDVVAEAVRRFGSSLYAVRLDTCGNRVHQGGHEKTERALEMRILSQAADRAAAAAALERYGFGPGVTIEETYAIRGLLDSLGAKSTRILVSSGFDLQKVRAFAACRAPIDAIGTGSWVCFAMFTADVVAVLENGQWVPRCKAGRAEELQVPESLPQEWRIGSESPTGGTESAVGEKENAPPAQPPES